MTNHQILTTPNLSDVPADTAEALKYYREALLQTRAELKQQFESGTTVNKLVHHRSNVVDAVLINIWNHFIADAQSDIALIAVGGYGRGELHPASDVDLLILLSSDNHQIYQENIEQLLAFIWDIGLDIGHSVRSINECAKEAQQDITIATNLMESRLLAGPQELYDTMCLQTGSDQIWPSRDFFEAKWNEQITRHAKYHDTAYNLEPNVKEGPGSLRDIQMIGWVAKRHFDAETLSELVKHNFLTPQEYDELIQGQSFLWKVRYALHTLTGRREDRLLFDHQKSLATQFEYVDDESDLAVEKFMQEYYRTVTKLSRLNEMLLQLFQEAILYADSATACVPINKRFHICNDFIEARDKNTFKRYPFALLEIFLLLEQNPEIKGVRAATIRLIREHRHLIDEEFRNDLRCTSLFIEILRQPHGITHELRRMNRYGILAAYLPVFAKIVGRMQYDLFHVYTVDDHTLMVLRNLRRFTVPTYTKEFPFCSEVIQRIAKTELLYIAALFHDIAKGRGGDHATLGANDAEQFCKQHGLGKYDTDLVVWLVHNHLIMSDTAQRKDISDPDVVAEFATTVADVSRLDYIYLLTVADIRGTSPKLWNSWKDSLLRSLHGATTQALKSDPNAQPDHKKKSDEHRSGAQQILSKQVSNTEIDTLWRELDDDYFLRHSAEEIAWQTRAICQADSDALPLVIVRDETNSGGTEIFVYAHDTKKLFAIIAAVLEQSGATIVDARIITAHNGFALDTFIVLDTSGKAIQDPKRIHEIESLLQQKLLEKETPSLRVTLRPARQLKHFQQKTRVSFRSDEQNRYTVMDIVTADRPGLLASLGQALMECGIRIQNAKIATFGAHVEDSFFITDINKKPLNSEDERGHLRKAIIDMLDTDE